MVVLRSSGVQPVGRQVGALPDEPLTLRAVTIADLAAILDELEAFWDEREMGFLHQALYVHEFGETSVLAQRDGRIDGYLLGFVTQDQTGYIHAVAVRREARGGGLARAMYARFEELASARDAMRLKAITSPENRASRAFHEALGFAVENVAGYSPSGAARLVFTRSLGAPVGGSEREIDLGDGVLLRPLRIGDAEAMHAAIEADSERLARWLPFAEQPFERTRAHVERSVRAAEAGRGLSRIIIEGDRVLGAISFVDPSAEQGVTQIGYWLAAHAEGRGLMTRAVQVFLDDAFGPWGFRRVEIRVAAENERSRAIPERLGFTEEAVLRSAHLVGGRVHDEVIYVLIGGEHAD